MSEVFLTLFPTLQMKSLMCILREKVISSHYLQPSATEELLSVMVCINGEVLNWPIKDIQPKKFLSTTMVKT